MKSCDITSRNYIKGGECSNTVAVPHKIKQNVLPYISSAWKLFPFNGEISWKMKITWKRQGSYRVSSFISSLECHFEEETFAFLITHHTKGAVKNFVWAKSRTLEGAGQGKGWLDCAQASFWNLCPSCSDPTLLTIASCQDLPGFPSPFSFSVAMGPRGTWEYCIPY